MNWTHAHLALNHLPFGGLLFSAAALSLALWRRSDELTRFGLDTLAATGLLSAVAFATGQAAGDLIADADPLTATVQAHADAAMIAMIAATSLGTAALWARLYPRPPALAPRPILIALLAAAGICAALMAWAAAEGGHIRHP